LIIRVGVTEVDDVFASDRCPHFAVRTLAERP
jgi:hypothetical protein